MWVGNVQRIISWENHQNSYLSDFVMSFITILFYVSYSYYCTAFVVIVIFKIKLFLLCVKKRNATLLIFNTTILRWDFHKNWSWFGQDLLWSSIITIIIVHRFFFRLFIFVRDFLGNRQWHILKEKTTCSKGHRYVIKYVQYYIEFISLFSPSQINPREIKKVHSTATSPTPHITTTTTTTTTTRNSLASRRIQKMKCRTDKASCGPRCVVIFEIAQWTPTVDDYYRTSSRTDRADTVWISYSE